MTPALTTPQAGTEAEGRSLLNPPEVAQAVERVSRVAAEYAARSPMLRCIRDWYLDQSDPLEQQKAFMADLLLILTALSEANAIIAGDGALLKRARPWLAGQATAEARSNLAPTGLPKLHDARDLLAAVDARLNERKPT